MLIRSTMYMPPLGNYMTIFKLRHIFLVFPHLLWRRQEVQTGGARDRWETRFIRKPRFSKARRSADRANKGKDKTQNIFCILLIAHHLNLFRILQKCAISHSAYIGLIASISHFRATLTSRMYAHQGPYTKKRWQICSFRGLLKAFNSYNRGLCTKARYPLKLRQALRRANVERARFPENFSLLTNLWWDEEM